MNEIKLKEILKMIKELGTLELLVVSQECCNEIDKKKDFFHLHNLSR